MGSGAGSLSADDRDVFRLLFTIVRAKWKRPKFGQFSRHAARQHVRYICLRKTRAECIAARPRLFAERHQRVLIGDSKLDLKGL